MAFLKRRKKSVCFPCWLLWQQGLNWQIGRRKNTMATATAIAPTVRPTTDTAMAAGTMGKAINTVVSLVGIKEMELRNKPYRICAA